VRSVDVAIVGAGPAGLVLALLLARSGRSVHVIEQAPTFEREYRGEGIQPGTRRIFGDLGLGDAVDQLDQGAPQGLRARIDARTYEFDFGIFLGNDPTARPAFVPQPRLLELLAGAARDAGASLVMSTAFKALRYDGNRICGVHVVDREGAPGVVAARLVVAADGRFSAVRRASGILLNTRKVAYDLIWFSAAAPTDANDLVYLNVAGPHVALAFPSRRHVTQVGWLIPKGTFAALRGAPFEELAQTLIARAPAETACVLRRDLTRADLLALLPIASECAARWWLPGLLLLGDAAHPMSPVAAQGINVAVQDAVVAARHLAATIDEPAGLDRALDAIERERYGPVRRIARQQNAVPAALKFFGPGRFLRVAIALALIARRTSLFRIAGRPLLDRFLWGDPPVRADSGPWHAREGLVHE
jgi:monooxygenase